MPKIARSALPLALAVTLVLAAGRAAADDHCRLVALGDVHGDVDNVRKALHAAKVVDGNGQWAAGCATLVQTGDIVDRGTESLACFDFFRALQQEAREEGGNVVVLLGNHEVLQFEGVTTFVHEHELSKAGGEERWRELFAPHGKYRQWLDTLNVVYKHGDTVFVHGGILPEFAAIGVSGINRMARWMIRTQRWNQGVLGMHGPLWTRRIALDAARHECKLLESSLALLGASRMVIGHTPEESGRIGTYCKGQLVRIDVGMSRYMMGHPAAVELRDDLLTIPIYPKTSL
jgi:hypothetical protein